MKRLFFLILPSLIFYGCGSSSNPDGDNLNLAQAAAAQYLNSECKSRIEEQKYWLAAKILLADKADKYKEQICACASQESSSKLTAKQMLALTSDNGRAEVVKEVLPDVIAACYKKFKP